MNRLTQSKAQSVHFEFTAAEAEAVSIAGTFNDWHPGVSPMIPLGNGRWLKKLTLLPGNYEYCLVVDGAWRPDPQANDTITNPFGGLNSVLKVAAPASPKPSSNLKSQIERRKAKLPGRPKGTQLVHGPENRRSYSTVQG